MIEGTNSNSGQGRCHYDVLDLAPGASTTDIQRAYTRSIALIEGTTLGGYALLDEESAERARAELEEARRVLTDPTSRAAYDHARGHPPPREEERVVVSAPPTPLARTSSIPALRILTPVLDAPPHVTPAQSADAPAERPAPKVEREVGSVEREVGSVERVRGGPPSTTHVRLEGPIDGATVRRLREERGLSVENLAAETRIRGVFLAAVEENAWERLPERVFLRGFLTQVARVLRVEAKPFVDGYLANDPRGRGGDR